MLENNKQLLNNPYGSSAFDLFRLNNKAYVDKSKCIKYLDDGSCGDYPVLLRPRRFGKSTFVRILKCYYDISYKSRYEELFSGSFIYKENLPSHNTYYVINFDFSAVSTGNLNILLNSFFVAVTDGIRDFIRRYKDFIFDYSNIDRTDPATLFNQFVIAYKDYTDDHKLYVIIDEYDNFANQILSSDLDLFLDITGNEGFLKSFYAAIKAQTSDAIAKTFITGVSSVSLNSLTSGFNIALNVTDYAYFNEYAGFTNEELNILIPQIVDLKRLGVSSQDIIARMRDVYDGYCFSSEADNTVFNSSMCLYYLNKLRQKNEFLNPDDYLDPACDQDASKLGELFNNTRKEITDYVIDLYIQKQLFYLDKLSENINLNQIRSYSREQILSMLYYLGYLTIDREHSSSGDLALMIPNRFMSSLFAKCTIDLRFRDNTDFNGQPINLSSLISVQDDITSFSQSCSDFLSKIMSNQVLYHMNEMSLNLVLFAKIDAMYIIGAMVRMQKPLQIPGKGEKFADLVITVNKNDDNECIYLIELKYLTKTATSAKGYKQNLEKLINDAAQQVSEYKTAIEFQNKNIKAYVMIFAGPECVYCQMQ